MGGCKGIGRGKGISRGGGRGRYWIEKGGV